MSISSVYLGWGDFEKNEVFVNVTNECGCFDTCLKCFLERIVTGSWQSLDFSLVGESISQWILVLKILYKDTVVPVN